MGAEGRGPSLVFIIETPVRLNKKTEQMIPRATALTKAVFPLKRTHQRTRLPLKKSPLEEFSLPGPPLVPHVEGVVRK